MADGDDRASGAGGAAAAAARPRRRRWPLVLFLVLVALAALVLVAPLVAAPLVRGRLVALLGERLGADVELEELSLGLGGTVRASGLSLRERDGRPLASVGALDVDVGVLALLRGELAAEATLDGFEVHVRREADGTWSFDRLPPAAEPPPEPEEEGELPSVRLDLVVRGGRVVVHGPPTAGGAGGGTTEVEDLGLELHVSSLREPARYALALGVRGPGLDRPARVTVEGTVTVAPDGRLEPARMRGELSAALEELPLSALRPALALAAGSPAGLGDLAGTARGEARFVASGDGLPTGTAELSVTGLRVPRPVERGERGERGEEGEERGDGAPRGSVELGDLALTIQATPERDELALLAGDFLSLRADQARERAAAGGVAAHAGQLALDVDVSRATRTLGPWLPLRAGAAYGGAVEGRFAWRLERGADGLAAAVLEGALELVGLSATDQAGHPLDLGELASARLALGAEADLAAGSARLSSFVLDAGPVTAGGHAGVSGLRGAGGAFAAEELVLADSRLVVSADLDRLRETLDRLLELGELSFGGRLELLAEAAQHGPGIHATAELSVGDLVLARAAADPGGEPRRFALDTFSAKQDAVLDLRAGGTTRVTAEVVAPFLTMTARGELVDVADPARTRGTVHRELRFLGAHGGAELVRFLTGSEVELLELAHSETLTAGDGVFRWEGSLDAAGLSLAAAGPDATPLVPLSLALRYAGAYDVAAERAELSALEADVTRGELTARLTAAGSLAGDRLVLERARLAGPGVELDARGEVTGLRGEPGVRLETDGRVVPAELAGPLASAAPGVAIAGEPLAWSGALTLEDGALELRGEATGARLELTLPPAEDAEDPEAPEVIGGGAPAAPRTLRQADLRLALDLAADLDALGERLDVRALEYASSSGRVALAGDVRAWTDPARTAADLSLEASSELGALLADLGGLAGLDGSRTYQARGALEARYALQGSAGRIALRGDATVRELRATLRGPQPGAPGATAREPLVVTEPEVRLEVAAALETESLDVTLERVHLASGIVWGDLTGRLRNLRGLAPEDGGAGDGVALVEDLHGTFRYVPDRLGIVLAPWLPGELSGAEEELLEFRFEGALADLDPAALLRGLDGSATVGLGRFVSLGLDTAGKLELDMTGDQVVSRGALRANRGTLDLDARLDLREAGGAEPPVSWLKVKLAGVDANPELGSLLGMVHPAFAALDRTKSGSLSGVLSGELELFFDGALTSTSLAQGWRMLEKSKLRGSGRLQIDSASLAGSPLLVSMLQLFGETDAARELKLEPIQFRIEAGRLGYLKPWQWTIAGTRTTFGGTIGLDRTLDLTWNVPVTDSLVAKHGFLAGLKGQSIELPIGGTVTSPRLSVQDTLKTLAKEALKAELKGELEQKLGQDLGALLGGGKQDAEPPAAGQEAPPTPEELLKQADELWAGGDKAAAGVLYRELREKHELSLVYLLNKKRIKERAQEPPPPPEPSGTP